MMNDSSSVKDDIIKLVVAALMMPSGTTEPDRLTFVEYLTVTTQFVNYVTDHDKIETLEDLEDCTKKAAGRIMVAMDVLMGRAVVFRT